MLAAAGLELGLEDFFAGRGSVEVVGDVVVELATFWAAIENKDVGRRLAQIVRDQRKQRGSLEGRLVQAGAIGEAEYRAARHLRISPTRVAELSIRRFGKTLTQERDERVKAKHRTALSPRSLQAARGHVMRGLLAELPEQMDVAEGDDGATAISDWLDKHDGVGSS